jgi:hypothetical protein
MTSASQMEICRCQRTVALLNKIMLLTNEGVTPVEPTIMAGTSQCGRVCSMSQRMAESVSQRNFYRDQGMHYMSSQATTSKMDEDLFYDSHLQLQERMKNPTAFHAEMMDDIMYLQQALKQPNTK